MASRILPAASIIIKQPPKVQESIKTAVIVSAPLKPPPPADLVEKLRKVVKQGVPEQIILGAAQQPGLGEPEPGPCPEDPPPFDFQPCEALPTEGGAIYNSYFAEENYLQGTDIPATETVITIGPFPPILPNPITFRFGPTLLGMNLTRVVARFGACSYYTQSWFVTGVRIGDLEAVRGLAPAEEVEVELRNTLTTRFDRSLAGGQQIDETTETTQSVKEIQSVMQTAASDSAWSQSSSSYYRLGLKFLWLNFGGGDTSSEASAQFSNASSQTMQTLRDTVSRAAETVRTQSKVEIRGVRETVVSERNVRRFRNPYLDRSLLLKVFSVFKKYRVSTSLSRVRLCLTLAVEALDGSDVAMTAFALANRDFLARTLLDSQLRSKLDDALRGLREMGEANGSSAPAAIDEAKKALSILFEDFLSTDLTRLLPLDDDDTDNVEHQRLRNSFFAQPTKEIEIPGIFGFNVEVPIGGDVGVTEAKNKGAIDLYMILYVLYQKWLDLHSRSDFDEEAVAMATAAAKAIDIWWLSVPPDQRSDAYKSSGGEDFAEIFRRLPGFRAYYDDFVSPLIMRRSAEEQERLEREGRTRLAESLLRHLSRYASYYSQAFLHWAARQLGPTLFATEVQNWLAYAFSQNNIPIETSLIRALVPPGGISLRDNTVIVEGAYSLEVLAALYNAVSTASSPLAAELVALLDTIYGRIEIPPPPTCVEIELPIDGGHIEAVPGTCTLPDVPVLPPPPTPPTPPIP
jgi:hypothetical protein